MKKGSDVSASRDIEATDRRQRGFTLVELMVTVAVIAIVGAIAAPSFRNLTLGSRLTGAANELVATLQTARMAAVSQRATVEVCPSGSGSVCGGLGTRWVAVAVKNGSRTLIREVSLAQGISVASSPNLTSASNKFTFTPNGFSMVGTNTSGTISVCVGPLPSQNAVDVSASMGRISSGRRAASSACADPGEH